MPARGPVAKRRAACKGGDLSLCVAAVFGRAIDLIYQALRRSVGAA